MESRLDRVSANHDLHYNCAQSVACVYTDLVNADHLTVYRLAEGLGGGLGNQKGTCGALLGACAVVGLGNSDGNLEQPVSKQSTGAVTARIYDRFEEAVGSVICGAIKGDGTSEPLMSCHDCMLCAARILEEEFFSGR